LCAGGSLIAARDRRPGCWIVTLRRRCWRRGGKVAIYAKLRARTLRAGAVCLHEPSRDRDKTEHCQPGTSQAKPAAQGESVARGMMNRENTGNQRMGDKEDVLAHGGPFHFGPTASAMELQRIDCSSYLHGSITRMCKEAKPLLS
jgi:hypothetical protein